MYGEPIFFFILFIFLDFIFNEEGKTTRKREMEKYNISRYCHGQTPFGQNFVQQKRELSLHGTWWSGGGRKTNWFLYEGPSHLFYNWPFVILIFHIFSFNFCPRASAAGDGSGQIKGMRDYMVDSVAWLIYNIALLYPWYIFIFIFTGVVRVIATPLIHM